jgi:hypothetical protein
MIDSVVDTSVSQVIAIVVAAFAISGINYVFTKNRGMYKLVRSIYSMLTTAKPTALEPHPPLGLVDVVIDHGRKLDALLSVGKVLVADSKTDDARDVLDRIEQEQTRVAKEHAGEMDKA